MHNEYYLYVKEGCRWLGKVMGGMIFKTAETYDLATGTMPKRTAYL